MSGEIITAGVAALGTLGGGIAWIWDKIDKRITSLETKVADCEAREDAGFERRSVQLTVIELLWQEVERIAPASPVLARAKKLLDDLKVQHREDSRP